MINLIGWASSFFIISCGIPQAWRSYREGHAHGLSWGFVVMLFLGQLLGLIYLLLLGDLPLSFTYGTSLAITSVLLWYKIFPKQSIK
jgi:uncharacterized protein with PQ loop repeat